MIRHFRKHGWQHDTAHRLVKTAILPDVGPAEYPLALICPQIPEGYGRWRGSVGWVRPAYCAKAVQQARKFRRVACMPSRRGGAFRCVWYQIEAIRSNTEKKKLVFKRSGRMLVP